jgi:hypothetical protein
MSHSIILILPAYPNLRTLSSFFLEWRLDKRTILHIAKRVASFVEIFSQDFELAQMTWSADQTKEMVRFIKSEDPRLSDISKAQQDALNEKNSKNFYSLPAWILSTEVPSMELNSLSFRILTPSPLMWVRTAGSSAPMDKSLAQISWQGIELTGGQIEANLMLIDFRWLLGLLVDEDAGHD